LNVVVNCRPDRVERNGQMGAIVPDLDPDTVFLIGQPTKSARDGIPAGWQGRIVDLGGDRRDPAELTAELLAELPQDSSLVAVGNIHGQGELLLDCLAELAPDDRDDGHDDESALDQPTITLQLPRQFRGPVPHPYEYQHEYQQQTRNTL
jgi:hypothetical protein